jgi:Tol biopolymer transport system component
MGPSSRADASTGRLARVDKAGRNLLPSNVLSMRMRTPVTLAALIVFAVWTAPAQAKLVYVKRAASASPVVFVAKDNGKQPRRLGVGRAPTISPDGRWVAFVTVHGEGELDTVVLQRIAGGSQRLVMRSKVVNSLRFSPDSAHLGAIMAGKRVRVYDIAADVTRVAAVGVIRGYGFSPDSKQIVVGKATKDELTAPTDLYTGPIAGGAALKRLTRTKDALYPVWGPKEIVFDRQKKRSDGSPAYNLWAIDPAGATAPRQVTKLKIPPLVAGLVPQEFSADGRRLLAVFSGQDSEVGFTVRPSDGKTRALSRDFEHGLVGFALTRDGKTILGHTGGPDPGSRHDVVRVPWGGGKVRVLVANAAYPDWSR